MPLKYLARIDLCSGKPDADWLPDLRSTQAPGADIESLLLSGNDLLTAGDFNYVKQNLHKNFCVFQEPAPVLGKKKVIALGKGSSYHSIVIRSNNKVYTWGANDKGQLGIGTYDNSNVPVAVDTTGVLAGKKIIDVAMSYKRSMALSSEGKVYMWGENSYGELGNNSTVNSPLPVAVDTTGALAGKKINHIAAGGAFSMALDANGRVYTWGKAIALGNGTPLTLRKTVPVAVDTTGVLKGKYIIAIAAEDNVGLALSDEGFVYTWGNNDHGQLGNDSTVKSSLWPVVVDTNGVLKGKTIVAIAAGISHALALASDGTVYAWGENEYGQLGNRTNTDSNVPVPVYMTGVLSGKKVVAIAAGGEFSLVLASDGKIYSWGKNNNGQLGNMNGDSNIPVAVDFSGVLNGKNIVDIAGGSYHCMALSCEGKVYSWGRNSEGQLGNNTVTGASSTSPVEVLWPQATAVNPLPASQTSLQLSQNFPNPFRQSTTIRYTLPARTGTQGPLPEVTLKIYDLTGREIATLAQGRKQPGNYAVPFNAGSLSPGIYFYKLRVGNRMLARKMVIEQ